MKYDPTKHHRRSIRLQGYDYTQNGAYFVTICTHLRECIFGEIINDEMALNTLGCVVESCWVEIPKHFPNVEIDEFIVMPNHLHGIIVIYDIPANRRGDLVGRPYNTSGNTPNGPKSGSLGAIIAQFKRITTIKVNHVRNTFAISLWQRNYYEHILRHENELNIKRGYILSNPSRWSEDEDNPARFQRSSAKNQDES